MNPDTVVHVKALERHVPYGLRRAADAEFPEGASYDYDLTVRLIGTLYKDQGSDETAPPVDTVLTPAVLAHAAEALGLQPTQLARAIQDAARAHVAAGVFVGGHPPADNPFVNALALVDETVIPTLHRVKKARAGGIRTRDTQKLRVYKQSTIIPTPGT